MANPEERFQAVAIEAKRVAEIYLLPNGSFGIKGSMDISEIELSFGLATLIQALLKMQMEKTKIVVSDLTDIPGTKV